MILFSVIIPTYNRLALLRQALESVWSQTLSDYEVIVVDDGSTDGTGDWLASHSDKIRILTQQHNRGPGPSRNLGAQFARGEYLAFLDSDDLWFPWTLETYHEAAHTYGCASIISGASIAFRDLPPDIGDDRNKPTFRFSSCLFDAISGPVLPASPPSTALRRAVLLKNGGFLEERINAEDVDLWLRLGLCPGFVRIDGLPVAAQRYQNSSITHDAERAYCGALHLINSERLAYYPGAKRHKKTRRMIIAAAARATSVQLLHSGNRRKAWSLFNRSLDFQLALGRMKYILGFPSLVFGQFLGDLVKKSEK